MKKYFQITLTPLTGLHIGTGEELTPFDYCIGQDTHGKPWLFRFATETLVEAMSSTERMELSQLADNEDIPGIRRLMVKVFKHDYALTEAPVTRELADIYKESLGKSRTQLVIQGMYRNPRKLSPMIPGSSIKGAIRTALLNRESKKKNLSIPPVNDNPGKSERKIQSEAFGFQDPKNDPLRDLIVRDSPVRGKKTEIVTKMEIYKKDRSTSTWEFLSMHLFAELIRGKLLGGDAKAVTPVLIDESHQDINTPVDRWSPPKYRVTSEEIMKACNEFYRNQFEEEFDKFYLSSDDGNVRDTAERLRSEIEHINESQGSFLLRLGRFSQVESMTLEPPLRHPWNKKGYGGTRTLALFEGRHVPVGWVRADIREEG